MLNIAGLALAMACCLFIIVYVKDELNYDKGFPKANRIFRITNEGLGKNIKHLAATSPVVASTIKNYIPEIQQTGRLHYIGSQLIAHERDNGTEVKFEEKEGYHADPEILSMFNLRFIAGNPHTALNDVNSVVLTAEMAEKYFGMVSPVGKTLIVSRDTDRIVMKVTGALKPLNFKTHLKFNYLISMSTFNASVDEGLLTSKRWSGFYTYALLDDAKNYARAAGKMKEFTAGFYASPTETREQVLREQLFHLQPITDIHLHSKLEKEMNANSDSTYIYIFSFAAILIMLMGCINFMNISILQSIRRMKEISVRKILGATMKQMMVQTLGESYLHILLSVGITLFLFFLFLPVYNELIGVNYSYRDVFEPENVIILLLLIIAVGLLCGLYPATFVSGFTPLNALKGKKTSTPSIGPLSKTFIVFQFIVSIFLIICTIVINRQMLLFSNKNLGFDKQQLLAVKLFGDTREKVIQSIGTLRGQLLNTNGITEMSLVSRLPGERLGMDQFVVDNVPDVESRPEVRFMWADENFVPAMRLEMKQGRNFFQGNSSSGTAFILNESAVKALHLKSPVGMVGTIQNNKGEIAGVVKDFNFSSLHAGVEPLVIQYDPNKTNYLLLKVIGRNVQEAIHQLKTKVNDISPGALFSYSFVDENLDRLYESEKRMLNVFTFFTILSIIISCLGIFGISSYVSNLRIKEIGIRKVLGASSVHLILLLCKQFLWFVGIAFLLVSPFAWWSMNKWLSDFAYRIDLQVWMFVSAGALSGIIAFLTVVSHAIRTTRINPIKSIRVE
ncbi:ABC transporter permease [Longitalea arenae]|uniref:ABC transporter permease n=1 Tax=Longitalea arenae TaxID=2812558 RepID=UPI0019683161|nr:ABC transporter permease [Longitalea arenae]